MHAPARRVQTEVSMPLRNFGLSFSRGGARANAVAMWRPAHGIGMAFLVVLLIVLALML